MKQEDYAKNKETCPSMNNMMMMMVPIVSKVYCSPSEVVLTVRRRPNVVAGGGFVVADCSQRVVFWVDGCGILGKKEEIILRDGEGNALLLIRRKGEIVEALSLTRQWKGYNYDYLGSHHHVFTLKQPNSSCFSDKTPIRISLVSKNTTSYGNFKINGDFPNRSCTIIDSTGHLIAQVGVKEEVEQVMTGKDLYHVKIMGGVDQAFVFGVIAVLDYTYDGSTRC
ncbi:protein LURP-one-related 6 [Sesamum alatum]|uniref:Protein LURP-one-related 6 n=1 Tax=Sesamum alatum TaxID=300844 RepID=A0AAE1YN13_9LAMI|nr:protein LURP-one-related 6 [Sesamum alatum]